MSDAVLEPEVAERLRLRAFVEACLTVEEGAAGMRAVDVALERAAGISPGPFAAADAAGLDALLDQLDDAANTWGDGFEPPALLQRLVAQGRTGPAAGQGFYPYPRPDTAYADAPVRLESRGAVAIAWLADPDADAGAIVDGLGRVLLEARDAGCLALVITSADRDVFGAEAAGPANASPEPEVTKDLLHLFDNSSGDVAIVAAVNGRAHGIGCAVALTADIRLAAATAVFGPPTGHPGRLERLVGLARAQELCLTGGPLPAEKAGEWGLVHRVLPDHELLDGALRWARRLTLSPAGSRRWM